MEITPNNSFSPPTEIAAKSNSTAYIILVLSAITIGLAAYVIMSKNLEKKKGFN